MSTEQIGFPNSFHFVWLYQQRMCIYVIVIVWICVPTNGMKEGCCTFVHCADANQLIFIWICMRSVHTELKFSSRMLHALRCEKLLYGTYSRKKTLTEQRQIKAHAMGASYWHTKRSSKMVLKQNGQALRF